MSGWVWSLRRGEAEPVEAASVPFASPALLFGESLFETFLLRNGRIYRLDAHLERLRTSIDALGWHGVADPDEWVPEAIRRLCEVATERSVDKGRVRVTLLRGATGEAGSDEAYEATVWLQPYEPPSPEEFERGVGAMLSSYRIDAEAPWARHKTGNRLVYRLAQAEAARQGAREGILVNGTGHLADGTTSNLFWIRRGVLHTPSLQCGGLPGITRQALLELAEAEGIALEQGEYTADSLVGAEELFCTNALIGVLPITLWNGQPIGEGTPGEWTLRLREAYRRDVGRAARTP